MEFEKYDINNIIDAFMKLFTDIKNCYHDKLNRPFSKTQIFWSDNNSFINIKNLNFHNLFMDELTKKINDLIIIKNNNKYTYLIFKNLNIMLTYYNYYNKVGDTTIFYFTLISDLNDNRLCINNF